MYDMKNSTQEGFENFMKVINNIAENCKDGLYDLTETINVNVNESINNTAEQKERLDDNTSIDKSEMV